MAMEFHSTVVVTKETHYLFYTSKERCKEILSKEELREGDVIDALINLHLVLEIGLNTFYRNLMPLGAREDVDRIVAMENFDNISIIDKTTFFIYSSAFDFGNELPLARQYHGIIGAIKHFSNARNSLLHGHAITTTYLKTGEAHSMSKKLINLEVLNEQVRLFRFIMEGMRFYVGHMSHIVRGGSYSGLFQGPNNMFLDDSFIPKELPKKFKE